MTLFSIKTAGMSPFSTSQTQDLCIPTAHTTTCLYPSHLSTFQPKLPLVKASFILLSVFYFPKIPLIFSFPLFLTYFYSITITTEFTLLPGSIKRARGMSRWSDIHNSTFFFISPLPAQRHTQRHLSALCIFSISVPSSGFILWAHRCTGHAVRYHLKNHKCDVCSLGEALSV